MESKFIVNICYQYYLGVILYSLVCIEADAPFKWILWDLVYTIIWHLLFVGLEILD